MLYNIVSKTVFNLTFFLHFLFSDLYVFKILVLVYQNASFSEIRKFFQRSIEKRNLIYKALIFYWLY